MAQINPKGTVGAIAEAVKSIFSFLLKERDPQEQALRIHNLEYKRAKQAVLYAHRAFTYYELSLSEAPLKHRRAYRRYFTKYRKKFYDTIAIE